MSAMANALLDELRRKLEEMSSLLAQQETKLRRQQAVVEETRRRRDAVELTMREFAGNLGEFDTGSTSTQAVERELDTAAGGGAFSNVVRDVIAVFEGEFDAPTVARMVSGLYPNLDDNEIVIKTSKVLARLGREGRIQIVSPGVSRRPARYQRSQAIGGHP